jgi:putative CocE/NonD family hydrolase
MKVNLKVEPTAAEASRGLPGFIAWLIAMSFLTLACAHSRQDTSWSEPPSAAPIDQGRSYTSRYLTMSDGTRLAADVYLPTGLPAGAKIPTILHQTRYMRSLKLRWLPGLLVGDPFDHTPLHAAARKEFVSHGYAWIDVDVRGSGASRGTAICPYSPDEVRDGATVVDWIIAQPWSNGRVGSLGLSYDGTATDFLLVNRHPAVKATAPLFANFDAYTDIAFPGGVHLSWFTENWAKMNAALDRNAISEVGGSWTHLLVQGVHPVEGADASELDQAVAEHAGNYDPDAATRELTYRDDIATSDLFHRGPKSLTDLAGHPKNLVGTLGIFSPHTYVDDLSASGAAIYSYSGWFDGAYAHAAIKRFLTVRNPGSRLVLGPWNHGGGYYSEPPNAPSPSSFDHAAELRRFFDARLEGKDTGIDAEKPVHYFTMVENKWKAADTWPVPARTVTLYFGPGHTLEAKRPTEPDGEDTYQVNPLADTGPESRWNTGVGSRRVDYPDRRKEDDKLLVYQSATLPTDVEVTGHPLITLEVTSNRTDGDFFVYLEDVEPGGRVSYVTEGLLRAIHRKLSSDPAPYQDVVPYRTFERKDAQPLVPGENAELVFDLLPTSYLFRAGHALRVALAGADAGHFANRHGEPPTLTFHRSASLSSHIDLPVVAPVVAPKLDAERIGFIHERLDASRLSGRAWWISWLTTFSALALVQGGAALSLQGVQDEGLRPRLAVGALSSLVGVVGVLLMPWPGVWTTVADESVASAEHRLTVIADAETLGHSWVAHLATGLVNAAGSLVLWLVFRLPAYAALNFVVGMGVGELQILTQPTTGIHDLADYHAWQNPPSASWTFSF